MSEQTEIEAVAQAIWEGLEGSRPGDIAAPSIRKAAEAAIAALDSLREYQTTPDALHEAQMEAEHYREQLAREREALQRCRNAGSEASLRAHEAQAELRTEREARERLMDAVSDTRRDLEELATHDQCAGWPTEGGCHVAMQGIAARSLTRLDEALSATGRET